jgi:hypothetical protein
MLLKLFLCAAQLAVKNLRGVDDNIKMDHKEITVIWVQLHRYASRCWAVVNVPVPERL